MTDPLNDQPDTVRRLRMFTLTSEEGNDDVYFLVQGASNKYVLYQGILLDWSKSPKIQSEQDLLDVVAANEVKYESGSQGGGIA